MSIPYELDTIMNNPKAVFKIYFPTNNGSNSITYPGGVIKGVVENDFTMDVSSLYSSVDPGQTSIAQSMQNIGQNFFGGANRVIKNVQQTLQQWDGHSSPSFSLPLTIVKYKPSIDIIQQVSTLMAAPAGTYEGITLKAPFGYGIKGITDRAALLGQDLLNSTGTTGLFNKTFNTNFSNNGSALYNQFSNLVLGTWAIDYSTWFSAASLIITHVSATISKETLKGTDEPLYARLNITFTTAFLPDARTIASWFKTPIQTSSVDTTNAYQASYTNEANQVAGSDGNNNAPL